MPERRPDLLTGSDPARFMGLVGAGAWTIWALFVGTQLILDFTANLTLALAWPNLLAMAILIASSATVVLPASYPLPLGRTIGIVAGVGASTWLVNTILPIMGWPGYSSWQYGANTLVLLALALRGRAGWAWIGMLVMSALAVAWASVTGQGVLVGISLVDRNAGILLVGTLFAVGLRRTMRQIQAFAAARERRARSDTAARAALAERTAQLAELRRTALPALQLIATRAIDASNGWPATEALLRDRIRAAALVQEPLTTAVRRARDRRSDVLLLDDSDSAALPAAALEWAARRVETQRAERVTVRLRRDGRLLTLTVVGDSGRPETITFREERGGAG